MDGLRPAFQSIYCIKLHLFFHLCFFPLTLTLLSLLASSLINSACSSPQFAVVVRLSRLITSTVSRSVCIFKLPVLRFSFASILLVSFAFLDFRAENVERHLSRYSHSLALFSYWSYAHPHVSSLDFCRRMSVPQYHSIISPTVG